MPLIPMRCGACGEGYDALVGVVREARVACPRCGGDGLREFTASVSLPGLHSRFERDADERSPLTRQFLQNNKKWLESPEMRAKRDSGEVVVKEAGPREFRPSYEKKVY